MRGTRPGPSPRPRTRPRDRVQLFRPASGLRVLDQARVGKVAVGVDGVKGRMAQLLREAEADLLDLVARQLVRAGQVLGVVPGDPLVPDVPLDRDLRGTGIASAPPRAGRSRPGATRGEHVVGLHVVDVAAGVGHVVYAEHEHLGAGGGRRSLPGGRSLRQGRHRGREGQGQRGNGLLIVLSSGTRTPDWPRGLHAFGD